MSLKDVNVKDGVKRALRDDDGLGGKAATKFAVTDETLQKLVSGSLLQGVQFDSGSVAYPNSLTEVYSLFENGLNGTLKATITLVYTNTSKHFLSTFEVVKS